MAAITFQNVDVQFRPGTQHQDYIQGFPASESTQSAGVEIKYATPWVRSLSNTQLSAMRVSLRVPVLRFLDSTTGNIWGWQIPYAIELSTDHSAFVEVVNTTFWGKTTSGYTCTHRINLPKATTGWTVRVKRLNVESTVSNIEDSLYIADYTTVIDGKLRHPNTTLILGGMMGIAGDTNFKTTGGFYTFNPQELTTCILSIKNFVQECFNCEKMHFDKIDALKTIDEVIAYTMNSDWPETQYKIEI